MVGRWRKTGTSNGVPQWERDRDDGSVERIIAFEPPPEFEPVPPGVRRRDIETEDIREGRPSEREAARKEKAERRAIARGVSVEEQAAISKRERTVRLERQIERSRGMSRESLLRQRAELRRRGVVEAPPVRPVRFVKSVDVPLKAGVRAELVTPPPGVRPGSGVSDIPTLKPRVEREKVVEVRKSFIGEGVRDVDIIPDIEGFAPPTKKIIEESMGFAAPRQETVRRGGEERVVPKIIPPSLLFEEFGIGVKEQVVTKVTKKKVPFTGKIFTPEGEEITSANIAAPFKIPEFDILTTTTTTFFPQAQQPGVNVFAQPTFEEVKPERLGLGEALAFTTQAGGVFVDPTTLETRQRRVGEISAGFFQEKTKTELKKEREFLQLSTMPVSIRPEDFAKRQEEVFAIRKGGPSLIEEAIFRTGAVFATAPLAAELFLTGVVTKPKVTVKGLFEAPFQVTSVLLGKGIKTGKGLAKGTVRGVRGGLKVIDRPLPKVLEVTIGAERLAKVTLPSFKISETFGGVVPPKVKTTVGAVTTVVKVPGEVARQAVIDVRNVFVTPFKEPTKIVFGKETLLEVPPLPKLAVTGFRASLRPTGDIARFIEDLTTGKVTGLRSAALVTEKPSITFPGEVETLTRGFAKGQIAGKTLFGRPKIIEFEAAGQISGFPGRVPASGRIADLFGITIPKAKGQFFEGSFDATARLLGVKPSKAKPFLSRKDVFGFRLKEGKESVLTRQLGVTLSKRLGQPTGRAFRTAETFVAKPAKPLIIPPPFKVFEFVGGVRQFGRLSKAARRLPDINPKTLGLRLRTAPSTQQIITGKIAQIREDFPALGEGTFLRRVLFRGVGFAAKPGKSVAMTVAEQRAALERSLKFVKGPSFLDIEVKLLGGKPKPFIDLGPGPVEPFPTKPKRFTPITKAKLIDKKVQDSTKFSESSAAQLDAQLRSLGISTGKKTFADATLTDIQTFLGRGLEATGIVGAVRARKERAARQRVVTRERQLGVSVVDNAFKGLLGVGEEGRLRDLGEIIAGIKPDVGRLGRQREALGVAAIQRTGLRQFLRQRQQLRERTVTDVVNVFVPPPPPPPGKRPPPPPIPFIDFPDKFKRRRFEEGFDVLIRRFGKFKKVTPTPLTRREALAFGGERVDRTLAASFKIIRAGRPARPKRLPTRFKAFKFRPAKREKGVIVERRRFRLSRRGEVGEIQLAKRLKKTLSL